MFFGKMSVKVLCPFLNRGVFFFPQVVWVLYIFWILTPYQTHGFQIFFPPHRLSFHFVVCFLCRNFLVNVDPHFGVIVCALAMISKNHYQDPWQELSSGSFILSGFTFKPLIHLEFILWVIKIGIQFHSFTCEYPVFPTPYWRLSFLHWEFLVPLSNISLLYVSGLISGLSIMFCWSICLFMPVPY